MKAYVAAPWTRRKEASEIAEALERRGWTVTHDWWNHECGDDDYRTLRDHAARDRNAVMSCDVFVLLNFEKSEGKAVETGMALARHRQSGAPLLIGVGPRYTNIFHHLTDWPMWFSSPLELLQSRALFGTADGTGRCSHASGGTPATQQGNR